MKAKVDYANIFKGVESSLLRSAERNGSGEALREDLDWAKAVGNTALQNADYFRTLVYVTFASGFRAATVARRLPAIDRWFPDHVTVAR